MGQRVMIAMMLVPGARPDDRRRADLGARRHGAGEVLEILDALVRRRGMGLIFISHDLDLVAASATGSW
jgi:peptide/nickel transport system ATP-binding protein